MKIPNAEVHHVGERTEQGIRNVKETTKRAENVRAMARKLGGKFDLYYTMGEYDLVATIEMPSDETYNRFALLLGSLGNVRSKTMKAWTPDEITKVIDELP